MPAVRRAWIPSPDWSAGEDQDRQARCLDFPPRARDAETGKPDDPWFQDAKEVLPICNGDYIGTPCPMRRSCLRFALRGNHRAGVWGGMTGPQRNWLLRRHGRSHPELWDDDVALHAEVPPPGHFKRWGNDDEEEEEGEG